MKGNDKPKLARFLGPLQHQAPERLLGLECSYSSDIYSLGFLMRQLLTGEHPLAPDKHEIKTSLAYKAMVVDGDIPPLCVNPSSSADPAPPSEHPPSAPHEPLSRQPTGLSRHLRPLHLRKRGLHLQNVLNSKSHEWRMAWKKQCSRFELTVPAESYSKELCDLIEECLQKNPAKRPTIVEFAERPFVTRSRLTIGLSIELKAFLQLQRGKLNGINSEQDYAALGSPHGR